MKTSKIINRKKFSHRFLLLAPVVAIPFLILMFWKMGVGSGTPPYLKNVEQSGFPAELPQLGETLGEKLNKLQLYEKADRDSLKLRELIRNDPYYLDPQEPEGFPWKDLGQAEGEDGNDFEPEESESAEDLSKEILSRLSVLRKELDDTEINDTPQTNSQYRNSVAEVMPIIEGKKKGKIETDFLDVYRSRLDSLTHDPEQDLEISQLNDMLDKVLDIQHPERLRSRIDKDKSKASDNVLHVETSLEHGDISILENHGQKLDSFKRAVRFYSTMVQDELPIEKGSILAAVHDRQEVTNGSSIKLHLLQNVTIAGNEIPKGTLVFARVNLTSQRMDINVSNIRVGNVILPVDLQVHDLDGMQGVNVPGNVVQQGIQESSNRSIQELGFTALDPSWETKAATMGIQAAKSLISKRIKVKKVIMPADYRVLLLDKKGSKFTQP